MSYGTSFVLTLFTNNLELARRADAAGINRVGLDLEQIGKAQRQASLNSWISDHTMEQLPELRKELKMSKLFVRTNPIHAGSHGEINEIIEVGAEVLMLPMFTTVHEAATFIELVGGRAEVSLLVETAAAAVRLKDIVRLQGIDEIHVGLNDMHLSLGLRNHFELLRFDFMKLLADHVRGAGIPFGFGGIARRKDSRLPVPPDLVYAQYPRLGADRALVSRVFVSPDYGRLNLAEEVAVFRARMDYWYSRSPQELAIARDRLWEKACAV